MNLFKLFLEHMLFGATMFAAAGTSLGTGGSGAGSGAGAGTSSIGSGSGAGSGEGGGAAGSGEGSGEGAGAGEGDDGISATGDQGGEGGEESRADANGNVTLADGRSVPATINKLFELAKTAGCEKEARQLYFGLERLKATVGGVNQAIELKKAFDKVGGVEGVQDLQSEVESHQQDAELFQAGDPKWVENAFAENSEQTLKHLDHALSYVSDKHPEHYDHMMAQVVLDTLNGEGSPIAKIYNALKGMTGNAEAQAQAERLARWYNSIKKTAKTEPGKTVDARTKAINDRESTVAQKETAQRYSQINATVFPQLKGDVQKTLEAEAKLVGADLSKIAGEFPGAFEGMMRDIHRVIKETAVKDKNFVNKYAALVKSGDTTRAATMLNKKHAAIIPAIVRELSGKSGLLKKKGAAAAAASGSGAADKGNAGAGSGANTSAGFTRINAKPANHLIDYRKTSQAMQLDGKYILKDGKQVQVHY